MKRKILALLMAFILSISVNGALPVSALSNEPYFELEMPTVASIKSELTVNVLLHGNPGTCGGVLRLDYDSEVFTLIGVEKGSLCAGNVSMLIGWDSEKTDISFATPDAVTGDGALLKLTFRVADTLVTGDYDIAVSALDLDDADLKDFSATEASKTVRLSDYLWGDANGDKVTNVADVQAILQWKVFLLKDSDLNMVAADADRNGSVGLTDALILLQWEAEYVEWDPIGATPPPAGI